MSAPTVRVGHPTFAGVPLAEGLLLSCSECGELTDWEVPAAKNRLQRQAAVHAAEIHDGLVEREGWA